ncbi:hypothetical protein KCP69_26215 [Salmonella enterica subsp. enterica]|nr:hypothetical protein KCP69_26215 [Salmonella enterica subsp. enterica]
MDQWKDETGYGFSLYSTPSENLCDRCRLDTAEFGVVPGVTIKGYYAAASTSTRGGKKVNPRTTKSISERVSALANRGFHLLRRIPEHSAQPEALEDVAGYSYQHVPYYGTNTPIDECYGAALPASSDIFQ